MEVKLIQSPGKLAILMGLITLTLIVVLLAACQPPEPACPLGSITYIQQNEPLSPSNMDMSSPGTAEVVEINGQQLQVDQVVRGMLCEGNWSGTVYVPCQVQVFSWEEDPLFLESCDLRIEPGTVVYVAAHNDAPYYQGCSCHTGEIGN